MLYVLKYLEEINKRLILVAMKTKNYNAIIQLSWYIKLT